MAEQTEKHVVLRTEIKALAQAMELRMRAAAEKVGAGELHHHKLMSYEDLLLGAKRNLAHFRGEHLDFLGAINAAADTANYALFVAQRIIHKGTQEE